MGLDMYLLKKRATSIDPEDYTHIGYWRKANHIHNWFVEEIQNGEDDQNLYAVTKEKAEELRDICIDVLKEFDGNGVLTGNEKTVKGLLPCVGGFLFGSTDYDDGYYEDVKKTVSLLNDALSGKTIDWDNETLYYSCWW